MFFSSELDYKLIENYNEQKRKLEQKLLEAGEMKLLNEQNYNVFFIF